MQFKSKPVFINPITYILTYTKYTPHAVMMILFYTAKTASMYSMYM